MDKLSLTILLIFPLINNSFSQQLSFVGDFIIYENVTKGYVIHEDIRTKIGQPQNSNLKLGPGSMNNFVKLDQTTGRLVLIQDIDLEGTSLCKEEKTCCRNNRITDRYKLMENFNDLSLDYLPLGSFCILHSYILGNVGNALQPIGKLALIIRDVNDNYPKFVLRNELVSRNALKSEITVKFQEGPFIDSPKISLPLAVDSDFSEEFRVKFYGIVNSNDYQQFDPIFQTGGLQSSGPFRLVHQLEKEELYLEIITPLDRETTSEYILTLYAVDGGNKSGKVSIRVQVQDVNEFDPVFVNSSFHDSKMNVVNVKEDLKVGSEISRVEAKDEDAPPGNKIIYKLIGSDNNAQFKMDPELGFISLKRPLDYESVQEYDLVIQAIDSGVVESDSIFEKPKNQRTSTAIIKVRVVDVNDNKPLISLEKSSSVDNYSHEYILHENVPLGTPVTYFSAIDRDSEENGQVDCHLENWSDTFRLNKFSGLFSIETISEIDREKQSVYNLKINCRDNGSQPHETITNIVILILDVEDIAPKFSQATFHYRVKENSKIGTKLVPLDSNTPTILLAEDGDINSTLVYRLEPLNEPIEVNNKIINIPRIGHQFFEHKVPEGLLLTKASLDRETYSYLGFRLCADDSVHVGCTNVIVKIEDVNDNPPQFKKDTHIIQVVENQIYLDPLIEFEIEDPDLDTGEEYNFTIIPDTPDSLQIIQKYFTFRNQKMYLLRTLDREEKDTFHFYVGVSDSAHKIDLETGKLISSDMPAGITEIFVGIYDMNDNQPYFIFPNSTNHNGNRLNVSCHEIIGGSVGSVQALDKDQGANGTIFYSMSQLTPNDGNDVFYLDNQTGIIYSNTNRLGEMCGSHFSFIITADDFGDESSKLGNQVTSERLVIYLQDQPTISDIRQMENQYSSYDEKNSGTYSISTKTILNVILGGSTIFLIGLLLIWIMLLFYHKNKRRHVLNSNQSPFYTTDPQVCDTWKPLGSGTMKTLYPAEFDNVETNNGMANMPIYNQLKIIESPKNQQAHHQQIYTISPLSEQFNTFNGSEEASRIPVGTLLKRNMRPTSVNNILCDSVLMEEKDDSKYNTKKINSSENILATMTKEAGSYQRVIFKNNNNNLKKSYDDQYCTFDRITDNGENVYRILDGKSYVLRSPHMTPEGFSTLRKSTNQRQTSSKSSTIDRNSTDKQLTKNHNFPQTPQDPSDFEFLQDVFNSCV